MAQTLFTSKGALVNIGRELGKGGEGSVFEVPSLSNQVAKVYHPNKLPPPKKQAKLSFMAASPDAHESQFLNYVAWPQETLHPTHGGPVIGFLLPKVSGKAPIHMVYSPGHRKQDYPKAGFDFLLYVARNVAATFESVHSHGYVIGDVNQDSFFVGRDATVVLIDSDSFQVNARGTMHLCEVGVPHFTPPELQSISSFNAVVRTSNHDNFGLALLLFHVLFGGRHPFSGVPLRNGVGDALETDIKNFCYAYARDSQSRGSSPPPRSIPISILPDAVESMFHLAFTEKGASGVRPTARQWVAALDSVRSSLKKCSASNMHVFPDHLSSCPWCALEQQGVVYFLDLGTTYTATSSGFVLARVWALIEQVPPPAVPSTPTSQNFTRKPKELPSNVPGTTTIGFYRLLALLLAVVVIGAEPKAWFFAVIGAIVGWVMAGNVGAEQRKAERQTRQAALSWAQREYDQVVAQLKQCGPEGFLAKRKEFASLRDEYINLGQAEKTALDALQATAHRRQLHQFLDRCFIDQANIKDLGPARKAALRSFGIETAADVERNRVLQVRGFGERLTAALVDWRKSCERRFTFNPNQAVSDSERSQVRSRFAAKKASIESQLSNGASELHRFNKESAAKAAGLKTQAEWAAQKLAQAQADLAAMS